MPKGFELDLSGFERALKEASASVGKGATKALGDIKDDWIKEARKIAPIDTGNLRELMHGEVRNPGTDGFVEVHANAHSMKGGDHFNYAYYIHEMNAGGKSLRVPGTEKKFLDVSGDKNLDKWKGWLEKEIEEELKRVGWS